MNPGFDTGVVSGRSSGQRQMRRTQEDRRNQAELGLLDAAAALFARRGADGTSLADIGKQAGYSRGLVNHHFGSKAALVERLVQRCRDFFQSRLPRSRGTELDDVLVLIERYLDPQMLVTDEARAFYAMWGAALPEDASVRPVMIDADEQLRAAIHGLIVAGQEHATIGATANPAAATVALSGMLRGISGQYLINPDAVNLSAVRKVCQRLAREMLSA